MQSELTLTQERISSSTILLLDKLIKSIDNYLNGFNQKEILSFSSSTSKESLKEYTENYFLFVSSIAPIISELTSLNAELASLLIKADKNMEIELIVTCEKKFNAFEEFERALYEYTSSVEKELLNPNANAAFLINATQKFKIAAERLVKENG